MNTYRVTDKSTGEKWIWSASELLDAVNADRSDEWTDYDIDDLAQAPEEVFEWVDFLQIDEVET